MILVIFLLHVVVRLYLTISKWIPPVCDPRSGIPNLEMVALPEGRVLQGITVERHTGETGEQLEVWYKSVTALHSILL